MNRRSIIITFASLLILQIKLITSQEVFPISPHDKNLSEKLYSWWRNETSLNLFWFPSNTTFTHYIVSIDPPDTTESIYIIRKKDLNSSEIFDVAFNDLHPSTFYNISVKKAFGAKIISETNKYWATQSVQPRYVAVDESSITPTSFRVYWDTENTSVADYYTLSLNTWNHVYYLNLRLHINKKSHEFYGLDPFEIYYVELRTVFDHDNNFISNTPAKTHVFLPRMNNKEVTTLASTSENDYETPTTTPTIICASNE